MQLSVADCTYIETDGVQVHLVEFDIAILASGLTTTFQEQTIRQSPTLNQKITKKHSGVCFRSITEFHIAISSLKPE